MTLLMSLFGNDYTILVSDRRLTSGSKIQDDEYNKAATIVLEDATLACAFTGLATFGNFSTQEWLLDGLFDSAPPDFLSIPTLNRFKEKISLQFSNYKDLQKLSLDSKKLAILFVGYHFTKTDSYPVGAIITNFSGFSGPNDLPFQPNDFVLRKIIVNSASTRVGYAGAWGAVKDSDIKPLNDMLIAGKRPNAVLNMVVKVFDDISLRSSSHDKVGRQLNSITIYANRYTPSESQYHVKKSSPIFYQSNIAILKSNMQFMTKKGMVFTSNIEGEPILDSPPIVVPKVHRNAQCPCGRKVRYRNCHGRIKFR